MSARDRVIVDNFDRMVRLINLQKKNTKDAFFIVCIKHTVIYCGFTISSIVLKKTAKSIIIIEIVSLYCLFNRNRVILNRDLIK